MSSNRISLEEFYRTQPPQHIDSIKVSSVLEFLAFSGAPIYMSLDRGQDKVSKVEGPSIIVDVLDDTFQAENKDFKAKGELPLTVNISFGYKRKRAYLRTEILKIENGIITLKKPEQITLTNLRRNPRIAIDADLRKRGLSAKIKASTTVGAVTIERAEICEMSQLGMSIFVDRSEGLLLPGDRLESLEIMIHSEPIFRTEGIVSRVDMKRRSSTLAQSYEVIVLFRKKEGARAKAQVARSTRRVPILDDKPCYFSAEHPLFPGRKIQGQVFELSTSGLSCMLDNTSFPVVSGMRFHSCILQLPHKPPREFVFEIAHVDFRSDGQTNHFRVGGEFIKAPIELIKDITAYAQDVAGNLVQDVTEADLDLLWEFMFETNFIYQDKRRFLQGRSKEILQTYHRLMSTDNPIVKKIVMKEGNEIKGHVSAIHFYDHAWIIQHLNALKASSNSAAQQVVASIVDFFRDAKAMQRVEVFYVMSFYRPNNIYPAVLFGETARRIGDPLKSSAFELSYGLYREQESMPVKSEYLERIVSNGADDMLDLSNHLIEKNLLSFMRACGLSQPSDLDMKLKPIYETCGLMRDRHLLSLKIDDHKVFGIVELSSVGLNLSELTNSIVLFAEGENMETISQMSSAVVQHAYKQFYEPRGICPVVLQLPETTKPFNVNWSKTYTCWITSAAGVAEFEKQAQGVIAEFKELVGQFKKSVGEEMVTNSKSA